MPRDLWSRAKARAQEARVSKTERQDSCCCCSCCGCCGLLTALRLVGHVATVDAAIAEPIAGYTLVNGLALELVVGTRVHCVSIVEVVVELVFISSVGGGGCIKCLCKYAVLTAEGGCLVGAVFAVVLLIAAPFVGDTIAAVAAEMVR